MDKAKEDTEGKMQLKPSLYLALVYIIICNVISLFLHVITNQSI